MFSEKNLKSELVIWHGQQYNVVMVDRKLPNCKKKEYRERYPEKLRCPAK